ncbi:MAG: cell division FtsZ family protein [Akkermansiaceae bacterium]|jgi:cell division protein FtsZ|nr:cell division FtsZ family protein [Akkermansiaceae bacterium]
MIEFPRDPQNVIPTSSVKIVGLGGAGTNMLDRVALDGLEGAEILALNTDIRTLSGSVATERIQLGRNLTKGLGTGGDPELGHQAVVEAEDEVRRSMKGRKIVFICVGLGGGTGSGAAPIVARIAREEGAFVVMFATMPFVFEGRRRREQAETALNELAVLSNALVTFDNSRMGELVLAKQGIHEAFAAADRMISESIKAVIRLVVRPGLINIGLDDLMSALRTTRSRCLFGSGIARGKDRAQKALRGALQSPLLDQGALLRDAESVLVHLCGGQDLTLFEIEMLMESLSKYVPEKAHVLFGAAVDPSMDDQLSITLVSSLPEERLRREPGVPAAVAAGLEPSVGFAAEEDEDEEPAPPAKPEPETAAIENPFAGFDDLDAPAEEAPQPPASSIAVAEEIEETGAASFADPIEEITASAEVADEAAAAMEDGAKSEPVIDPFAEPIEPPIAVEPAKPVELPPLPQAAEEKPEPGERTVEKAVEAAVKAAEAEGDDAPFAEAGFKRRPPFQAKRRIPNSSDDFAKTPDDLFGADADATAATPKKKGSGQTELSLDGGPKGRFEGADPSLIDGEDLDVPPFLRRRR